jgi:hypothetical protein
MMSLNRMQKAVVKNYACGEYEHCKTINDVTGDTLLKFILIELSDSEDCENIGQGISRMTTAKDDIAHVIGVLAELSNK